MPSGKHLHNYGKSQLLMGKSTISMAMFNSYVKLPEGNFNIFLGLMVDISNQFLSFKATNIPGRAPRCKLIAIFM